MGHFFFTQPNPAHILHTQPIVPAHGITQVTHSTAKQIESSIFNSGMHNIIMIQEASCQLKSCQLPRNSAETTCSTTSPEQIEVMKLEG